MANFIALDLDSQGLYAVAGDARGPAKVVAALAWTGDDGDAPPPLTVDTAKAVGEKLRDKLRAAGFPTAPVLVSVGRDRVILKELKYPAVPAAEEPALVRFQAMKEMSESPDDVVLDYAPLDATGDMRRSMVVVVRKELFNAVQAMCQAAGVKLAGVTPRPYAVAAGLVRAFAAGTVPPPAEKTTAFAALTLSAAGGEFTVVRQGEVTYTLAVPAPVVASETMLVAQIRRNLAVYAGQHPGHPIEAVYLAEVGGPWAARLRTALGVPVHDYDPLAGAVPAVPEPLRGRFAGATGLLAGKAAGALPINFAATRQPVTTRDPAKRKLLIVAALAAVLLVAGAAVGYWLVSNAEDDVARLNQEKTELTEKLDKNKPTVARIDAIDAWAKREVVWLDELHELASKMPADDSVRISSYNGIPIPPGKDGKQEAQARVEMRVTATSSAAGNALVSAYSPASAGPNKYYLETGHTVLGLASGTASKHNEVINLFTKVIHRPPAQYGPTPPFAPLKRTTGGVGGSAIAPPAPPTPPAAPAKVVEVAPHPTPVGGPGA